MLGQPYKVTFPILAILLGIDLISSACAQNLTENANASIETQSLGSVRRLEQLGLPTVPAIVQPLQFGSATTNEGNLVSNSPPPQIQLDARGEAGTLTEIHVPTVPDEFQYLTDAKQSVQLVQPWWNSEPPPENPNSLQVELEDLIWLAIPNSPHVQAILLEPQILDTKASQQLGAFDPNRFADSIFKDTSDPVGNTLITGGPSRLNQGLWENRAGVRAKNQYGGQAELFQEMFFKDSNSRFFVPAYQSNTRMVLNYTQPLKRGSGKIYNRSSFMIASFAADQGRYQAAQLLQEHAYNITEAYWELYTSRVSMVQILRGIRNLESLRDRLVGRGEIDIVKSQLYRAEAAIANQKKTLMQARQQMVTSDAQLRALVASPELRNSHSRQEIVPISVALSNPPQIDATQVRLTALENQPRILEIQQEIKAARTKLNVAQNELMPTLNLVLQGYLAGLKGDNDLFGSLGDQFSSRPSYNAGIAYQRPKGNIAALAMGRESRMELQKAVLKLDDTLLNVGANVDAAIATIEAAYQALESSVQATVATKAEIEYLEAQWENAFLAAEARNGLQLDQLLNAHIQLISSENNWVQAQRDYMLSMSRLDLVTGKLLPVSPLTPAMTSALP